MLRRHPKVSAQAYAHWLSDTTHMLLSQRSLAACMLTVTAMPAWAIRTKSPYSYPALKVLVY